MRGRSYCVLLVVLCVAVAAVPAPVAGDDPRRTSSVSVDALADESPETADGFLTAFRALEDAEALQSYSEFEVVRSQAVLAVQAGEFGDDERRRMTLVLTALRTFRTAYNQSESGDRIGSLETANRTSTTLDELAQAGGSQYASLARLGLDRFYEAQGEAILSNATVEETTPRKLSLLGHAASAYRQAGVTSRFSELTIRVDRLRTEYESDVTTMNESAGTARSFLADCGSACESPVSALTTLGPSVFGRYGAALDASRDASRAVQIASEHRLSRASSLASLDAETRNAVVSLAAASVALTVGYTAVLSVVALLVWRRLRRWNEDLVAARLDGVVVSEAVGDA